MPGVPSFLIPRSAEVRPLAEGPPVADPLIAIEDEDDPCCCVVDDDADASACWNADIVYRVYRVISMVQNERDREQGEGL